jgi:hypothetical protein
VDWKVIHLNDFKKMDFYGTKSKPIKTRFYEKGQKEE